MGMRLNFQRITRVLAFSPLLYLTLFYTLVFRVWQLTGKFPYYGDDSDRLDLGTHRDIVVHSFTLTITLMIIFFFLVGYIFYTKDKLMKRELAIATFCCFLLVLHFFFDPMLTWFAD